MPATTLPRARVGAYLWTIAHAHRRGEHTITSQKIAADTGIGASQIRRDLMALGRIGTRGVGYSTEQLLYELRVNGGVFCAGSGPVATRIRESLPGLRPAGLWAAGGESDARVLVLDEPDPDFGRTLARAFATAGVPLIVNYGEYLLDDDLPARVVNASPLLPLLTAITEEH